MRLQDLQDRLRSHIRLRISRRELTGSGLSRQAGLPQGHLSNFLNSRRRLSLASMDRLLETLQIEVLDLVDAAEIRRWALPARGTSLESVALVSAEHAARSPRFTVEQIDGTVSFQKTFLRRLKPNDVCARGDWLRFVSIKLDARTVRAMFPRNAAGATLLIDRHYTSLDPYHHYQPNLYVIRFQGRCAVGYVSLASDHLVLRPCDVQHPIELARIDSTESYFGYIVGRVCHASIEI